MVCCCVCVVYNIFNMFDGDFYDRELRTLPGLMLINLIMALFVAQLLFLLNAWGLFETDPVLCLIMATAQHYFWLASFVWMGCLPQDIFRCFATACTIINTYSASMYTKYMLAGWMMPLPFPLIVYVPTVTTSSSLVYNTSGPCWLAKPQGVLYLFAIPVFTICSSLVVFIVCASWWKMPPSWDEKRTANFA